MKSGSAEADQGEAADNHAFMIVYMDISDLGWMDLYFQHVPALLTEYGATQIAGGRTIVRAEGDIPIPDRIAIFCFPSLAATAGFLEDERYQRHRASRMQGSSSQILILESATLPGVLV